MIEGDVKKAQTAKKRNCRTKADINGQENKTVGSQAFSCLKLYAFLNLTLGVPSYAFGQALTAVNTAVKVRLIHSEHFFLSPKNGAVKKLI